MKIYINLPWRLYIAEFFGTFVFVLVSSGSVLANIFFGEVGTLGVILASGFALGTMIYATRAISGGHLNPAVTLAMWFVGKISILNTVFYITCQVLASFSAAFLLIFIFGRRALDFNLGAPILGGEVTSSAALLVEAILTAVLVFAVFATMVDRRGTTSFGPLTVGFVVIIAGIFSGPISGGVLNPSRVIGPIIVSGTFDNLPIWILGPALGSLFGPVYNFLFLKRYPKR